MTDFKVIDVATLVPFHVKYEVGEQLRTAFGYIDYETLSVYVENPEDVPLEELKKSILDFLRNRELEDQRAFESKVPPEVYQQIANRSQYDYRDYIPKSIPIEMRQTHGET